MPKFENAVCEWCEEPATMAAEVRRTANGLGIGQFIYACRDHADKAKTAATPRVRGRDR